MKVPMPKSGTFGPSLPIGTRHVTKRSCRLLVPAGVVEPVAAEQIPSKAGVHVGLARGFASRGDGVANAVGGAPDIREGRLATGRHRALHRGRIPDRKPF